MTVMKRKHMADKEILDKYIDLEGSCLTKWEKHILRNLIYNYKRCIQSER